MTLDNFIDSETDKNESDSSKRTYDRFTREDFEECLADTELDFEEVKLDNTKELVYDAESGDGTFVMRVYSSLSRRSGKARDKGSDAIRTVVIHKASGRPVLKEKRTNRIKTWRKNLKKKINNLQDRHDELNFCDDCGRLMVIRENSKNGSKFWGCTGWRKDPELRKCSNTEPTNG
jgi:hypothetical protein